MIEREWYKQSRNNGELLSQHKSQDASDYHMDIPAPLKEAVETGAAVLMLGSGASLAARDAKGNRPPTTPELAKLLCGRFLSPDYEKHPLTQVADSNIDRVAPLPYPLIQSR